MGEISDHIEGLVVEATSPDGRISATVSGPGQINLAFQPGAYDSYTEDALAHQLSQLATLTWTRRQRYIGEILELARGDLEFAEPSPGSPRWEYNSRLEQLVSRGKSSDGSIFIATRAMLRWEIAIASGTLKKMPESQFGGLLMRVLADTILDHRRQIIQLQDEVYGFSYPDELRRGIGLDTV